MHSLFEIIGMAAIYIGMAATYIACVIALAHLSAYLIGRFSKGGIKSKGGIGIFAPMLVVFFGILIAGVASGLGLLGLVLLGTLL